ncbi:hypothetical protein [Longispora urticae]
MGGVHIGWFIAAGGFALLVVVLLLLRSRSRRRPDPVRLAEARALAARRPHRSAPRARSRTGGGRDPGVNGTSGVWIHDHGTVSSSDMSPSGDSGGGGGGGD